MPFGEPADAEQRGDYGDVGLFGQVFEVVPGAREQHALAGDDDWLACLLDQPRGLADLANVRLERRLIAGQIDRAWLLVVFDSRQQDVFGHVDVDWARAPRSSQVE